MSVQNILNPATGQISNAYIDVAGLGVITNPLTANIDGTTAYGLVDANVVSTGTLQADTLEAYSTLPGAPIAVVSNVKLQSPADRIDMEKVGANTIAVPDGSLVLTATDPATTTATAYLDQGSLRVENAVNAPSIFANAGSGYNAALSASAGGQITYVQANAPGQQLAIVADVINTKNIINAVGQPLDIQTNTGGVALKPENGIVKVGSSNPANPGVIELEQAGGAVGGAIKWDQPASVVLVDSTNDIVLQASNSIVANATANIEIGSGNGGFYRCGTNTTAGNGAEIVADDGIRLEAIAGPITLKSENNGVSLAGLTAYDTNFRSVITSDLNKPEQISCSQAYTPMVYFRNDFGMSVSNAITVAHQTPDFTWRYSGIFGPSGITNESLFCSAPYIMVNVSVAAEDMNDTIVWWLELENTANPAIIKASDYIDERFGYINDRLLNPSNSIKNQTFSFTTVFDVAGSGTPIADGDTCRFNLMGYGSTNTSSPKAQISITVRPLRNWA